MELSNPVLSGLIRKRQELMVELGAAQAQGRQIAAAVEALDATIRLFNPTINLELARVRTVRIPGSPSREMARQVLGAMREAGGPVSYSDVALAIMRVSGANLEDKVLVEVIRRRAGACIRRLVSQGMVAPGPAAHGVLRWQFASVSSRTGESV